MRQRVGPDRVPVRTGQHTGIAALDSTKGPIIMMQGACDTAPRAPPPWRVPP
jgi:hypothetical protein